MSAFEPLGNSAGNRSSGNRSAEDATTAALLTAEVASAIATIGLAGPLAKGIVDSSFRDSLGRLTNLKPGNSTFGRWTFRELALDPEHVVLHCVDAQHFELHCHGGRAICQCLLDDLQSQGAVRQSSDHWPTWSSASLEASAELALIGASTLKVAAILLDQFHGSLRRSLEAIADDWSNGRLEQGRLRCEQLLSREVLGRRLLEPWTVGIVGPPNVGKSSLANAILGTRRVIVHEEPGTTRDAVDAAVVVASWPMIMTDTAGVRDAEEAIEMQGIAIARLRWRQVDVGLLVVDATSGWSSVHDELAALRAGPTLAVLNKVDLAGTVDLPTEKLLAVSGCPMANGGLVRMIPTQATDPSGIAQLLQVLGDYFDSHLVEAGEAVPFLPEHCDGLRLALRFLEAGKVEAACQVIVRMCETKGLQSGSI